MAFGVAFSITADLGTSPISSVPYTISLISPLTVGTATIAMHCVFIALQILILRKKYHPFQLLQLPVAFIFGYLTDFAIWVLQFIHCDTYWERWIICGIGIVVIAVGVSLEVISDVVTLAGEGLSLAICQVAPVRFGNMKVIFDITLVIIACILGLISPTGFRVSGRHRSRRCFRGSADQIFYAVLLIAGWAEKFRRIPLTLPKKACKQKNRLSVSGFYVSQTQFYFFSGCGLRIPTNAAKAITVTRIIIKIVLIYD